MFNKNRDDPLWSFKNDDCRLQAMRSRSRHATLRWLGWPVVVVCCLCVLSYLSPDVRGVAIQAFSGAALHLPIRQ